MSRYALLLLDAPDESPTVNRTRAVGVEFDTAGLTALIGLRDMPAVGLIGRNDGRFEVECLTLIDRADTPIPFVVFTDLTEDRAYLSVLLRHNVLQIDFDPSRKSKRKGHYTCVPLGMDTHTRLTVDRDGVNVYAYGDDSDSNMWEEAIKYETYLPWQWLERWLVQQPWEGEVSETARNLAGQVINDTRADLAPILADALDEAGPNCLGAWLRRTPEWSVLNCTMVRSLAGLPPLPQDEDLTTEVTADGD